jgi:hypothetical protein
MIWGSARCHAVASVPANSSRSTISVIASSARPTTTLAMSALVRKW